MSSVQATPSPCPYQNPPCYATVTGWILSVAAVQGCQVSPCLLHSSQQPSQWWCLAGYTVLHHAVAGGNIEIVNTLLRTGHATPDTESSRNRITPLHVAAKHGRVVLLPVLMQAGYKAQAITSDGK